MLGGTFEPRHLAPLVLAAAARDGVQGARGVFVPGGGHGGEEAGHAVAAGAAIGGELPVGPDRDLLAQDVPRSVRYEDEETLGIDKAPGLVVHPAPGLEGVTLINVVRACFCNGVRTPL